MSVQDQFSFLPPVAAIVQPPPAALRFNETAAAAAFEEWWSNHVWLKRGKWDAQKAYFKILRDGRATVQELSEGADRYAEYLRRNPTRYVKWPQGWLSAGRFADDLSTDDRGSAERSRSAAHLDAARLFGNRGGLR